MYAINSQCQWWVSIATWSQPTSYQRRVKQGCLTTSYERSTRRWLVAFSIMMTKGAAAPVARSESIATATFTADCEIVLLSESTLPKTAMLQRRIYGICALTYHLSHIDRLVPAYLDACARTRRHLPRRIPPEHESGVPRRMSPEYESKDANANSQFAWIVSFQRKH